MSDFDQSGTLAEEISVETEYPEQKQCDCCGEWHPQHLFNDEATELCDHCMEDWDDE